MGCCQKKKSEQLIEKEESKEMQSNPDAIKLTYNDFQPLKLLGTGSFGRVLLVRFLTNNQLYAMKILSKNQIKLKHQEEHTRTERNLMVQINSPFIVNIKFAFQDESKLYIVSDFMQGGDMFYHLHSQKKFDESRARFYAIELILGIEFLHKNNMIYRDLKPENILMDSTGHLKISDFGVSAIKSDEVDDLLKCHGTVAGPIQFMAPEMCFGDAYDFKSDIYMLGLTFWFMASSTLPEKKISLGPLIIPIKNPNAKLPDVYSDALKSFINTLLKPPEQRPSTSEAYYNAIGYYSVK